MKFVLIPDSFKGTLSSPKTAELLTQAAREIFPDCVCDSIEVADGGEGTTDALIFYPGAKVDTAAYAHSEFFFKYENGKHKPGVSLA